MKFATIEQLEEIFRLFQANRNLFPHIRKDTLLGNVMDGECVYQDDVVLTFKHYKRKVKIGDNTHTDKNDCSIRQILAKNRNGSGSKVFREFFNYVSESSDYSGVIYLTVRSDNERARKFYEKHGMEVIDSTSWAKGKLEGVVYKIDLSK